MSSKSEILDMWSGYCRLPTYCASALIRGHGTMYGSGCSDGRLRELQVHLFCSELDVLRWTINMNQFIYAVWQWTTEVWAFWSCNNFSVNLQLLAKFQFQ